MNGELYHGTRAGFRGAGGLVLPGDQVGRTNWNLGRSDVVYVTPDIDLAWDYARSAKGRGNPKVLVVQPHSALIRDDSTINGEEQVSFTTCSASVLRVLR